MSNGCRLHYNKGARFPDLSSLTVCAEQGGNSVSHHTVKIKYMFLFVLGYTVYTVYTLHDLDSLFG